ncbi:hypothetical protein [Runella sp. SP2]|nr:hypothetical protein [Runella sp. SP2]
MNNYSNSLEKTGSWIANPARMYAELDWKSESSAMHWKLQKSL